MSRNLLAAWAAAILLGASAQAAEPVAAPDGASVTVTLGGVRSDAGRVVVTLCGDRAAAFPGGCSTYAGRAQAHAGQVDVSIAGVKPGVYALQAFHDENDDGRPEIPPEGYAFGNDAGYPPSFDAAAVTVAGDTHVAARLVYLSGPGAGPAQGSGAPPPAGVAKTDVRDQGLYAELYVPAHAGPLPAIVMIGGSEGGLDTISRMAISFTRHGYAVMALAYWGAPGLPQTLEGVPLEYFHTALDWLKTRPEVDPRRIGLIGWSRGAEAALLVATREPDVRAVAAIAPSNMVWLGLSSAAVPKPAWTVRGSPLPFMIPRPPPGYRPGMPLRTLFETALADAGAHADAAIPVERVGGPILLLSGTDDAVWPSSEMAERIMARLKAKHFRRAYRHLTYAGAGHLVFVGDPAMLRNAVPANGANAFMGGSPAANASAWSDDWPRTVAFFDSALER